MRTPTMPDRSPVRKEMRAFWRFIRRLFLRRRARHRFHILLVQQGAAANRLLDIQGTAESWEVVRGVKRRYRACNRIARIWHGRRGFLVKGNDDA